MARFKCRLLVCLLFFVFAGNKIGVAFSAEMARVNVHSHGAIILDDRLQWLAKPSVTSVEEAALATDWKQPFDFFARVKLSNTLVWLRFGLNNPTNKPVHRLLILKNSSIEHVHLFTHELTAGYWLSFVAGQAQPFMLRELQHRYVTFPILLPPNTQRDVYLRLSGTGFEPIRLSLVDQAHFEQYREFSGLWSGLFLGFLAGLVGCVFLAAWLAKAPQLLIHGAYGLCVLLFLFSRCALGFQLLWFDSTALQSVSDSVAIFGLIGFGSLILVQHLANLPQHRFVQMSLKSLSGVSFLLVIFAGFLPTAMLQVLQLICVSVFLIAAVGQWPSIRISQAPKELALSSRFIVAAFFVSGAAFFMEKFLAGYHPEHPAYLMAWLIHFLLLMWGEYVIRRSIWKTRVNAELLALKESFEQERSEREKLLRVVQDPITGFPNRLALLEALEAQITDNPDSPLSLYLVRFEGLKNVTYTFGHEDGDELNRRIGRRLDWLAQQYSQAVNLDRSSAERCVVAFVDDWHMAIVYNPQVQGEMQDAVHFGNRLIQGLSYPFDFKNLTLDVCAYIGVASVPEQGRTASELLCHAHVAVELGIASDERLCHYVTSKNPYTVRRLSLVNELQAALRLNLLELKFQPQVHIKDNTVVGLEALIRWSHPHFGEVPPNELIPLAEETGGIHAVTAWVLEAALAQAALWYQRGLRVRTCVNLSAKNLQKQGFASQVDLLLNKYRLPAEYFALEITGTAMMGDPQAALKVVAQLHELGIRLSLDDYGIGFCSLSYLKQLPISEIKIDRTFVRDMCDVVPDVCDEFDDQIIVNTTLNMCHNLGLEVVAEGVEDERTFAALKRLGCDLVQGFFIAEPMSVEALDQWFASSPYHVIDLSDGEITAQSSAQK